MFWREVPYKDDKGGSYFCLFQEKIDQNLPKIGYGRLKEPNCKEL